MGGVGLEIICDKVRNFYMYLWAAFGRSVKCSKWEDSLDWKIEGHLGDHEFGLGEACVGPKKEYDNGWKWVNIIYRKKGGYSTPVISN